MENTNTDTATLTLDGETYEFPLSVGTEDEVGVDIGTLRSESGAITLDPGYGNTGSCESEITFINGEEGVLRYRGYPIEELAEQASFPEVCYLLVHGALPSERELSDFNERLAEHAPPPEAVKQLLEGFSPEAHPMSVLSSQIASLAGHYPGGDEASDEDVGRNVIRLLSQVRALAAFAYRKSQGEDYVPPQPSGLSYTENFLHMMFADADGSGYESSEALDDALDMLLILHADHEQNCSASTVRMVGSSGADLFASVSAGVGALSGPLHGGANTEVIRMLQEIHDAGGDSDRFVEKAKDKDDPFRLMGFGHRVYKNFDPRAKIIKSTANRVLDDLGTDDPLLGIARRLEEAALEDDYFVKRRLYPNVDFYSGILYRAMGIPTNMFTVMFSMGRLPGWIAQWKEMRADEATRIYRPRQVYVGAAERSYTPVSER